MGYNTYIISTIVDKKYHHHTPTNGYNTYIISTIVDGQNAVTGLLVGYNTYIISTIVDIVRQYQRGERVTIPI